jgi:hypothetical protein
MLSTIHGIQGLMTHVVGAWGGFHPGHPGIESELGHGVAHLAILCAVLGPMALMTGAWLRGRARSGR